MIATLAVSFSIAACDDGDDGDPVSCADEDCDDQDADDDEMVATDADAGGEAPAGSESSPPPPTDDGGTVVPECESLCACVEGLGGDRGACGRQCSDGMFDQEPDDRAQCIQGITDGGFLECSAECDAFPDGS